MCVESKNKIQFFQRWVQKPVLEVKFRHKISIHCKNYKATRILFLEIFTQKIQFPCCKTLFKRKLFLQDYNLNDKSVMYLKRKLYMIQIKFNLLNTTKLDILLTELQLLQLRYIYLIITSFFSFSKCIIAKIISHFVFMTKHLKTIQYNMHNVCWFVHM